MFPLAPIRQHLFATVALKIQMRDLKPHRLDLGAL